MNFADYRKNRLRQEERRRAPTKDMSTEAQKLLYHLRLKTMEQRTLMLSMKKMISPSDTEAVLVEYSIRLNKAKKNFTNNNYNYEWDIDSEK